MESPMLSKSKIKSLENKFALQEVLPSFRYITPLIYFNLELNGLWKYVAHKWQFGLINKTKVKSGQLGKYCFFSGSPACAKCVSEI